MQAAQIHSITQTPWLTQDILATRASRVAAQLTVRILQVHVGHDRVKITEPLLSVAVKSFCVSSHWFKTNFLSFVTLCPD